MKILGVKIDNFSKQEILEKIEDFLDSDKLHQIVTTNAEFILQAQKDLEFRNILNDADLSVADTITIRYAFWRHFKNLKTRLAGVDLMQEILKMASEKKLPIFLVTKKGGLSSWQETRKAILKKFPDLEIDGIDIKSDDDSLYFKQNIIDQTIQNVGAENFLPENIRKTKDLSQETLNQQTYCKNGDSKCIDLLCSKKWIVFCNFGIPEQDKFIASLRKFNGKICLGMGVGGSFDFLTGKVKRAPKWMRRLGFEWIYRLIQQPNRWKRMFRAVIIFPIRVIFNK